MNDAVTGDLYRMIIEALEVGPAGIEELAARLSTAPDDLQIELTKLVGQQVVVRRAGGYALADGYTHAGDPPLADQRDAHE